MVVEELNIDCQYRHLSGGVMRVQYVPLVDIVLPYTPILTDMGVVIEPPTFLSGNRWLNLPFLVGVPKTVSSGGGDTKFGVTYRQILTQELPPLSSTDMMRLHTMKIVRDFIVQFQDRLGQWWLLGDSEFPCFFDFDQQTNGHIKVTWTANNIRPILIF